MEFYFSADQQASRDAAVKFANQELNDGFHTRDLRAEFSRELWKKCADFGILGMPVSRNYGSGNPQDIQTATLVMEGLGYGCRDLGLLFGLNAQMWTVQLPIMKFGTEEQKQRLLPLLCSGQWIAADAMTEPDAGSDIFNMTTTAQRQGDYYVLNGSKCMITLAPVADVALTFAMTDPSAGQWGVSVFCVETGMQGVERLPAEDKLGLRTIPMGELRFNDCRVPVSDRIGAEGAGFAISQFSLEHERCCILASQLGAMEYQLERAVDHAKTRVQFGKPVGNFQSISNRIADMKLRLEMARLMLYKVAWMKQEGQSAVTESAILKLYLSEAFTESSMDSIRVHGGHGYLSKNGIEHSLRDSVGGLLYAGTSDIQRNIIAKMLGI